MLFGGQTRLCPRNHALDGGRDPPAGRDTLGGTCIHRHPSDNGHVQFSPPSDVTSSTQQGRHAAAMRPLPANSVAACFELTVRYVLLLFLEKTFAVTGKNVDSGMSVINELQME